MLHPRPVRRDLARPGRVRRRADRRRSSAARRRGKYLWLPLDSGDALLGHLGMSGQMLVQPPGAPDERHLRVRFVLSPVERARLETRRPVELRFVDQRMFGGLSVSDGGADLPPRSRTSPGTRSTRSSTTTRSSARVRRRTAGIKRLLLDQTLVSGVGNIYADEALWRARLHGERPGDRLRPTEVAACSPTARAVMGAALAQGGTSFDALYVNVNGESGYFDRSLHAYGREGRPCDRCGTPIRRVAFMNRSSFFCPRCQPVPRARRVPARAARLTRADRSVTLEGGPLETWRVPHVGRLLSMAKALIGHLQQDRGLPARLAAENAQLRVRVAELEALVTRLMEENDRLAVAQAARVLDLEPEQREMQPA